MLPCRDKHLLRLSSKFPPQYSFLGVFGCSCFLNIRDFNAHKLQFRLTKCTFVGYSHNHKGYRSLAPHGKIRVSRNVIFNDSSFLFSKHASSSPGHSSIPQFSPATSNQIPFIPSPQLLPSYNFLYLMLLPYLLHLTQSPHLSFSSYFYNLPNSTN